MLIELSTFHLILAAFIFAFGCSMGSFLNMISYRLPRNISVFLRRSFCPKCKKNLSFSALIPILGYFFIRGKCETCSFKIPIQYPIVEAFSGILTVLVFFKFLHPELLLGGFPHFFSSNIQLFEKFHFSHYASFFISLWLLYTGIPLTLIDLKYRILPDVITLPGTLIGFFISCLNPEMGWLESLVGILVGSGGLFLISKLYQVFRKREGMGLGDVKYLGFIGAVLGWQGALFTLFIASILGSLFGIAIGIINKKGLSTTIPFGPFLACAALTVSLYSKEILLFYL